MKSYKKSDILFSEHQKLKQNLKNNQDSEFSPCSPQMHLITSPGVNDEKLCTLQNNNSLKRIKNKWSYYTRNSKTNQISLKDRTFDKQSLFYSNSRDIQETENSVQNPLCNSSQKFQLQLSSLDKS
ncbi:hypothetical protein TTHERM_00295870 (macronuclear) [Tetrahymena thermophila SB210]|uniref:Uncharacterized protein n=1 Tax=Tetrahymena thermophila (strain SB210) TaxID=312017 RepID=I7M0Z1_TETTS|nr:hypothetical protein TTHERM_00295870 [Tetrahymena thermophila SB210]EAR92974.2 hypothetical protein TTHERM_00295870 [Tetrahymena thermophila SB210]|eukprot:XP_001013219.2 hypothetical protein TTHERM_00295870 [Tetrahymena thermophila SB210]